MNHQSSCAYTSPKSFHSFATYYRALFHHIPSQIIWHTSFLLLFRVFSYFYQIISSIHIKTIENTLLSISRDQRGSIRIDPIPKYRWFCLLFIFPLCFIFVSLFFFTDYLYYSPQQARPGHQEKEPTGFALELLLFIKSDNTKRAQICYSVACPFHVLSVR